MRQSVVTLADMARLMAEGYTVRQAAAELHVHENTLYYQLRKHGLRWWPICAEVKQVGRDGRRAA